MYIQFIMNFPGHKYLGPGNKLDNGEPIDKDDLIAQQHDKAYGIAKSAKDIHEADLIAINQFWNDAVTTGNYHSLVGAAGLSVKHLTEKALGKVIYPRSLSPTGMSLSNKKRYALTKQEFTQNKPWWAYKYRKPSIIAGEEPDAKKLKQTVEGESSIMDPMDIGIGEADNVVRDARNITSASGGAAGNNSGGGMRGQAVLPSGFPQPVHTQERLYTKQYRWRIKTASIDARRRGHDGNYHFGFRYPYYDFPVDLLGFYLSDTEIEELKRFTSATVTHCKVDTYSETAIMPFHTNTSNSSVANNNIGIKMAVLGDVSKLRTGGFGATGASDVIRDKCWGSNLQNLNLTAEYSTLLGDMSSQDVIRNYDLRFEYMCADSTTTRPMEDIHKLTWGREQVFPIQRFIKERINVSINEGPMNTWEYSPRMGLVAGNFMYDSKFFFPGPTVPQDNLMFLNFQNRAGFAMEQWNAAPNLNIDPQPRNIGGNQTIVGPSYTTNLPYTQQFMNYKRFYNAYINIDEPFVYHNGQWGSAQVPNLTFGLEPILNSDNSMADGYCVITMNVSCSITLTQGTTYAYSNNNQTALPDTQFPGFMTVTRPYSGTGIIGNMLRLLKNVNFTPRAGVIQPHMFTAAPDTTTIPTETTATIKAAQTAEHNELKRRNDEYVSYQQHHDQSYYHKMKHVHKPKKSNEATTIPTPKRTTRKSTTTSTPKTSSTLTARQQLQSGTLEETPQAPVQQQVRGKRSIAASEIDDIDESDDDEIPKDALHLFTQSLFKNQ